MPFILSNNGFITGVVFIKDAVEQEGSMAAEILVTGATGTVGRILVRDLALRGTEVRAGVHTPEKFDYIKMSGIEDARLEFGDNATLDRALQDIHTVIIITPFAREQVEFTRRIVDRARTISSIKHIIDLSILGAGDMPGSKFTRWHYEAEKYIEMSGIPYTFLRPNLYMQNFVVYVQPAGNFMYIPLDGARVSYIDVRDVAAVATEIAIQGKEHYGAVYELTGPESLSMDEVAQILTDEIGSHISYIPIPDDTARHVIESTGTPQWMAEGMIELFGMQKMGRYSKVNDFVENILGRKAISFDRFAHDYSTVFKALVQHERQTHLH